MSALKYSVTELLIGKSYYSKSRKPLSGIIQEAIEAPEIFYQGAEAYKVRVRPVYKGDGNFKPDFWATVCVGQHDEY